MDSLPEEIQDQIIQNIPVQDLPKIMHLSKTFYRQARPHFYKSVHYFDVSVARPRNNTGAGVTSQHSFALMPNNARAWDPASSARIVRLAQFLRTITETQLSSPINEASLSTVLVDRKYGTKAELEIAYAAERECLNIFSQITSKLVIANSVVSLDLVHTSIFSIVSLRHLCLRNVRSWRCFGSIPDDSRVRTSNIILLSFFDTVPLDTDLQEILKWPKGLQYYNHENTTEPNGWFSYDFQYDDRASPQRLLQRIASQRETLQELSYNNLADRSEDDETIFDAELLSQFTKLTHINVPRECLIAYDYDNGLQYLNKVLFPNLLELILFEDQETSWQPTDRGPHITAYIKRMGEWLQEVAHRRDSTLPPLEVIINWEGFYRSSEEYRADTQTALEEFKGTDIRMAFFFEN